MKTTDKPLLQDFQIEGVKHISVSDAFEAIMLNLQGYPHVPNLDGGLMMWKAKGLPFDNNISSGGCGCNSGTQSKSEFTSLKLNLGENLSKNIDFKNLRRI